MFLLYEWRSLLKLQLTLKYTKAYHFKKFKLFFYNVFIRTNII